MTPLMDEDMGIACTIAFWRLCLLQPAVAGRSTSAIRAQSTETKGCTFPEISSTHPSGPFSEGWLVCENASQRPSNLTVITRGKGPPPQILVPTNK